MSEMAEPGYTSQEVPQRRSGNSLVMVKTLLENPGALKRMRVMSPDEERYVRPPREYELPAYRQGMRVLHVQREVPAAHSVVQPP